MATSTDLPRDLARMTPAQVEQVIAFYVSLPLANLRSRQRIAEQQRAGADVRRHAEGIRNLQINMDLLAEAVFRQTWPEEPQHTIDIARYR
jgi:hypothetical protein